MSLITWTPQFSVNVPELDAQHQKLIDMVNQLHDAMTKRQGKAVLQPLFNRLVQYTVEHFATEEKYMQKAGYEDFAQHKAEHDNLKKQVADLKQKFESNQVSITLEVMTFLEKWLTNHIMKTDKKYAPVLAGK